jgi:signal recognition particle subunit SRP54
VFDSLSDKLQAAFDGLKKQGRLSDKDVERAAREIRLALLEADVNFKVVKQFVDAVKGRALGAEVLESLTPAQQFIKIVSEELTALMGSSSTKLTFSARPPTVVMMVGLQGSGKTTACGKLANFLLSQGKSPALAAGDVYRPAAIDQLRALGEQLGVPVYDEGSKADPVHIAKNAVDWLGTRAVTSLSWTPRAACMWTKTSWKNWFAYGMPSSRTTSCWFLMR